CFVPAQLLFCFPYGTSTTAAPPTLCAFSTCATSKHPIPRARCSLPWFGSVNRIPTPTTGLPLFWSANSLIRPGLTSTASPYFLPSELPLCIERVLAEPAAKGLPRGRRRGEQDGQDGTFHCTGLDPFRQSSCFSRQNRRYAEAPRRRL